MPILSRFTPIGLLEMSGATPLAESLYKTAIAGYADQRDVSAGTHLEAMCYADAITSAFAMKSIERAGDERLPSRASQMLDTHEWVRGIVSRHGATIASRRAELERRWRLPQTPTQTFMEAELAEILGAHFVRYELRTMGPSLDTVPAALGDWPMNLQDANVPRKQVKLLAPVAFVGFEVTFTVELLQGKPPIEGDVVVFDVGRHGIMDRVTLTSAEPTDDGFACTATFTKPHAAGALGFTGPMPYWMSARRFAHIVVDTFAAGDPELRRLVNEFMARTVRGTVSWGIVEDDGVGGMEVFKLGEPSLGRRVLYPE